MHVGVYKFHCLFESQAVLPEFKGSAIRGGLGHTLKAIACALRLKSCAECLLSKNCAYAFIFEAKARHGSSPPTHHAPHRPLPYVLRPPDSTQRSFKPGDDMSFSLLLFGRGNDYLPYIIYAVKEMGKNGIGRGASTRNAGRFSLDMVKQGDFILYKGGDFRPVSQPFDLSIEPAPVSHVREISISCITPVRLKSENRL
ncbi:MAG: CRISPR system precrRNA processing endoribonuclease RAMP protein Cas6, partial [Dissulfurimicrobium sp.]